MTNEIGLRQDDVIYRIEALMYDSTLRLQKKTNSKLTFVKTELYRRIHPHNSLQNVSFHVECTPIQVDVKISSINWEIAIIALIAYGIGASSEFMGYLAELSVGLGIFFAVTLLKYYALFLLRGELLARLLDDYEG